MIKNLFLKFKILCGFVFCFVWFSVLSLSAEAVTLYLEPAQGQYHQGDTFLVDINIDTQGQCINAIEVNLSFPQDILKAVDFSKGESIITFWVQKPKIDQNLGLISFTGGIPGGYCGILPGDPREYSNLGRIAFKAHEFTQKRTQINTKIQFLDTSQVLLNDGLGTPAELITREAIFTILPEEREIPKDEWQEKLKADIIPPEPFEIKIEQNPVIFEGKYFIIFSTTDKQTGIDYFEVQEGRGNWRRAESPYLLENQRLDSIIRVRAIDMAGNERIVEHPPLREPFPYWIIVLVLMGIGVIWWIITKATRDK